MKVPERKTMNIADIDEVIVNQLAVARQSIEERDQKIWELQTRVELLENLLNRLGSQSYGVPSPQLQPIAKPAPKRWSIR
jgi:hypothetical protein